MKRIRSGGIRSISIILRRSARDTAMNASLHRAIFAVEQTPERLTFKRPRVLVSDDDWHACETPNDSTPEI